MMNHAITFVDALIFGGVFLGIIVVISILCWMLYVYNKMMNGL